MENLNKMVTTINNLDTLVSIYDKVNLNIYIETEEYIYYIDASQDYKLYRIFKYDGKKETIVDYKVENFVITKNNIFYTIKHERKITLIKCDLEGKNTYIVCKYLSYSNAYCIHNEIIYYCENHNFRNYIKSMPLNNGIISTIHESVGCVCDLHYFEDHIYYRRKNYPYKGEEVLKKINISSKPKDDVVETFYNAVYFYKNYMIYKCKNSSLAVIKNLETGKKVYEMNQCNNTLGIFNKYILFTYEGFTDVEAKYVKNMLYMLNIETFSVSKLTDCNVSKAQIIDNYIYYKIKDKDSKIYRQNINGEDKKVINLSNKYSSMKALNKLLFMIK
ncbi:DUF5050 domain-containing protein [Clostridium tetanomorphum]|uniref:DUF5050 domain-containing protein n=1 Tax=Clostridium tetanomorphum TaxID=1553 RepID=A0A923EEC6_CLOTT|nr:DUF5050 domain-containing protein [Clostridium tetanomorphum]MBC2399333.1 DUF5050 domain-containing protein [Clostridium tetanomorphum]NRZ98505.1 hypothetical protein [Clostridium tetanomorphum]